MSDATRVLWQTDLQNDFTYQTFEHNGETYNGKLAAPNGNRITDNAANLNAYAEQEGYIRAGSSDAHPPDDPEFDQWGEHCVYGTPGQQLIPEIRTADTLYVPNEELSDEQLDEVVRYAENGGQVIFEKRDIDVATNPNVEPFINTIDPDRVDQNGLVREECVNASIDYHTDHDYEVAVIVDAIAGIDPDTTEQFHDKWREQGAELTTTNYVVEDYHGIDLTHPEDADRMN